MSRLGSMVVRLVLENLPGYKADLNQAANATTEAAAKIEASTTKAGTAAVRMGGTMGGAADAAMGLASSAGIAGAVTAALAVGIGAAAYAAHEGSKEQQALQKALILTGNVSGTTAGQMQAMAAGIGNIVGSQHEASKALAAMAGTGQVAGSNLQAFSQVAVQMERTVGTSVADTAKTFAELGEEPVKASIKLNQSMNYLTAATYAQIKAAQDLGDTNKAADIAQSAYADAMAGRTEQIRKNLGLLETAWIGVKDMAGKAWSAMLGLGREESIDEKIAKVTKQLDTYAQERQSRMALPSVSNREAEILQAQLAGLSRQALKIREVASAEAERAQTQKAGIEAMQLVDRENDKALSKQKQMTKALDDYHQALQRIKLAAPDDKRLNPDTVADTEAAIRKRYEEKTRKDYSAEREQAERMRLGRQQAIDDGNTVIAQNEAYQKALEKTIETLDKFGEKEVSTLDAQIAKRQEANDQIGLTKAQIDALNATKQMQSAADDEEYANALRNAAVYAGEYSDAYIRYANALELTAQKKRQLAALDAAGSTAQEAVDAAKKSAEAWKHGWDETDRLAREVFSTWATDGADAAKKIGDTLKKALASAIYEVTLKPIAFQLYASVVGGSGTSALSVLSGGGAGNGLGMNDAFSAASALQTAKLWVTDFGGQFAEGMNTIGQKLYSLGFEKIGGGLMDATSTAGGFSTIANYAQAAGNALGYLNAAVAASEGRWGAAVGSGIGTFFGGPIGAIVGNAIGNWVDSAFGGGHEYTTATGISGSFGASGFSGRQFQDWRNDGSSGLFGFGGSGSSSGTNYSALDAGTTKSLSGSFLSLQAQTAGFAQQLGLSAQSIFGFSKQIRLQLGSDAAANKQAIVDMLSGIADDMARTVLDSRYIRDGETAASTLARLATNLSAVNAAFFTLDKTMLPIGQAGGDAASSLVDLMGGLDAFNSATSTYYQNFYTESERTAKTAQQLAASFESLGVSVPDSVNSYKDLVNAQDVSTEAGRSMYAALISLSGAFITVSNAAADAAKSLINTMNFATYADYATAASNAGATPVPRFAEGGSHSGGLRWVGEKGIELEATGPSRIWNAAQIASAVAGNSGSSDAGMTAELRQLREENRAQARTMATLYSRMVKLFDSWDINGMPEVRTA